MARRIIFENEIELLDAELIVSYPMGFLSEVEVSWPYTVSTAAKAEAI